MSIAHRKGGGRLRTADRSSSARRGRRDSPDEPMRVVALGGGHGLASNLRALRLLADEITAVVTVADNGGCLLYTSPSPRDATLSRMPSSA